MMEAPSHSPALALHKKNLDSCVRVSERGNKMSDKNVTLIVTEGILQRYKRLMQLPRKEGLFRLGYGELMTGIHKQGGFQKVTLGTKVILKSRSRVPFRKQGLCSLAAAQACFAYGHAAQR